MQMQFMKPPGRVIDGTFVGRGQWVNIAITKAFSGFFVANLFLRGGGRGGGGDANTSNNGGFGVALGQGGSHGQSAQYNTQVVVDPNITIGVGSAKGADLPGMSLYFMSSADTSDPGGTTTIVYGNITRTALGGQVQGAGGWTDYWAGTKSNWDPLAYVMSPPNPNGNNYGRMGGRASGPGAYLASWNGVVQVQLVD